ncbi:MAG: Rid family detoxifying hydrolase [Bacteroidales bacterium]
MRKIKTHNAPLPAGHYSQAIVHNDLVFVSGQLPIDPNTGEKLTGEIEKQTTQVFDNLKAILHASDSSVSKLLKVTIYLSDISLWDRVNSVYTSFMGENKPARSIVPTRELHHGVNIEVEAIAATNG